MLRQNIHRRWWLLLLVWCVGSLVFHAGCNCGGPGAQDGVITGSDGGTTSEGGTTETSSESTTGDGVANIDSGPEPSAEPTPETSSETSPETVAEAVPEVTPEASTETTQEATPDASVETTPEVGPETIAEVGEPVKETTPEVVPEPTAPKVVSTVPKDGEKVEQPKGNHVVITVTFDQDMDAATLNTAAFAIQPLVTGKVSVGKNGKSLEFRPDQDLPLFKKFTVTIKTSVKSKKGVAMAQPYTFSFETKAPGTEPKFLGTFSAAGGVSKSSSGMSHHTVLGHGAVSGKTGGSGFHTVQTGFIYTFTY